MGERQANWTNLPELGKLISEYDVEVLDVHNITTGGHCWGPVESYVRYFTASELNKISFMRERVRVYIHLAAPQPQSLVKKQQSRRS